jgi:hypothetical protein
LALSHSPSIITQNLVLCLDAANPKSYPGSGTTWTDLSGNGNNGTLVNGVGYSGSNLGSLSFDGVDDSVRLSTSSTIQNLTTNFTISAIVKTSVSGGQYGIFTKGNNYTQGWTLYLRQGPQFAFVGNNVSDQSSGIIATPSGEISTNIWYFITYTYNGSSVIGYVNSQQKVSSALSSFVFSSVGTIPTIGVDPSIVSPTRWNGNIAQVSIYNRALTASEIQQNYNALKGRFQ